MNTVKWAGTIIGVNRRSALGKKRINGILVPMIRTSDEYKTFKDELTLTFRNLDFVPGNAIVAVSAMLRPRRDLDSFIKPLFDALEAAGVVENDRMIKQFVFNRLANVKQNEMEILEITVLPKPE